jgi:hypothetical protein
MCTASCANAVVTHSLLYRPMLYDLFTSDIIFDKFEICCSPDGKKFASGSYRCALYLLLLVCDAALCSASPRAHVRSGKSCDVYVIRAACFVTAVATMLNRFSESYIFWPMSCACLLT